MDVFFSKPSTLWAGGFYNTDESLKRKSIERIYVFLYENMRECNEGAVRDEYGIHPVIV